jgi:hypothetical protein
MAHRSSEDLALRNMSVDVPSEEGGYRKAGPALVSTV